ncbi:HET domain-containing protein [Fusarium sp. LHS14.1]|nr:HET domain-containing protein [Fusarium sp. LHS14.1]
MAKPGNKFSYSRLGDPTREIRLLELQAGQDSDPVKCDLVTSNLDEQDVAYEALSYTWGTDDASCLMLLDGGTFGIRPNLEAAFRRLRKTDKSRRLWVDAVCINQDDIEERNAQVRSMLRIYKTASRVLVWLGPASDHSHLAMARRGFMHNFHAINEEMWDEGLSPSSPRYLGFADLTSRPWWRRTWVIQEVVVSKAATVLCGPDEIEWEQLAFNLAQLIQIMSMLGEKAPMSISDETVAIAAFRMRHHSETNPSMGLLETMNKFRSWLATDPRDKVYGLLGLATDDADGISVNYSMPVNQVYENVALHSLKDSYKVMGLADPSSRRQGLASWAPDWSTELPFYPFRISTLFGSPQAVYSPSTSAERSFKVTEDGKCLTVQVEMLSHASPCGSVVGISKEGLRSVESIFVNMMRQLNWPFYPDEESTRIAFRRTIIVDTLDDHRINQDELDRYFAWFDRVDEKDPKPVKELDEQNTEVVEVSAAEAARLLPGLVADSAHRRDLHRDKTAEKDDEDFFRAIGTTVKGRVIFINLNGFVGLGPEGAQNGDHVCIPVGGDMPWLVRPVESGMYEFVGECYVHGLMDGDVEMPADSLRDISLM